MIKLDIGGTQKRLNNILCLGAHSDDIEIGCGGTIIRLINENPTVSIKWVVFSSDSVREAEALAGAGMFLKGTQHRKVTIEKFNNGFFPYIGGSIKKYFEKIKLQDTPDLIFTHYRDDYHQDHRLISELTWNTFRNHLILEYEIVKYDGGLGSPNLFVELPISMCKQKVKYINTCFKSQKEKQWFSDETFYGLMRIRGVESNSLSGYAEAFYSKKLII
jgi:LmbE family N-acetylglucosaminyl deacetylase